MVLFKYSDIVDPEPEVTVVFTWQKVLLNPEVHSLPFAATMAAAAVYILYQNDFVFQPLALSGNTTSGELMIVF